MKAKDRPFVRNLRKPRFIYALCEPNAEFAPRYVGQCIDIKRRMNGHFTKPVSQRVLFWLAEVECKPKVAVLEVANGHFDAHAAEKWWIQHLLSCGHDLLNSNSRQTPREIEIARQVERVVQSVRAGLCVQRVRAIAAEATA